MQNRKRILMLSPIFPLPLKSGGQVRIFNIIKNLSRTCDISLISLADRRESEYCAAMNDFCAEVKPIVVDVYDDPVEKMLSFFKPGQLSRTAKRIAQIGSGMPVQICRFYHQAFEQCLKEMMGQIDYDIVHAVYAQMAPYLTQAQKLNRDVKTILVDIDLSFVPIQRESLTRKGIVQRLSAKESSRMADYVSKTWPTFDRIVVMSDVDRETLQKTAPDSKIAVVPNGVDVECFKPRGDIDIDPYGLVFLGGSRHQPNVDAVVYFLEEIFPLVREEVPEATLRIVGEFDKDRLPENVDGVELTGFVEDVQPYVQDKALFVVPLRIGGGTRLKILEAMALGIPVVSTSVGYEGIDAAAGKDILVEDDPKSFARSIVRTLKDKEVQQTVSANGRRTIEEKYDWKNIARSMERVYDELLECEVAL